MNKFVGNFVFFLGTISLVLPDLHQAEVLFLCAIAIAQLNSMEVKK